MLAFSWPGNVRQLHNAVVHAATMRQGELIEVEDFPPETLPGMVGHAAPGGLDPRRMAQLAGAGAALPDMAPRPGVDIELQGIMADAEAVAIRQALAAHGGNVSATARTLGIARATLYTKLARHGIAPHRGSSASPAER